MGKQLNLQATLLHGEVQLVELALRTAAGNSGILNISHRVPFDDLAKRMPGAVLAFVPQTPMEQLMYNEYVRYFGAKARAGVANLDDNDSLYLVPPVGEAQSLLAALEAAGVPAPLPRNCLLGVITAKPTAAMNTTVGVPAPAAAVPAVPAVPPAPAAAAPVAAVPAEADAPGALAPAASEGSEKQTGDEEAKEATPADGNDGEEDGEEGGGLSGEALANLFSNPELLQALQGMDEPGDD